MPIAPRFGGTMQPTKMNDTMPMACGHEKRFWNNFGPGVSSTGVELPAIEKCALCQIEDMGKEIAALKANVRLEVTAALRSEIGSLQDALKSKQQENMKLPQFGPGLQQAITMLTHHIPPADRTALDAYVQERVSAAETKGWQDCLRQVRGSVEGYPDHGGDIEIMTAIDRIVQERVAEARIAESERGHEELHGCKPFRHDNSVVYCKWCAYHAELENAANRAKVAGSK